MATKMSINTVLPEKWLRSQHGTLAIPHHLSPRFTFEDPLTQLTLKSSRPERENPVLYLSLFFDFSYNNILNTRTSDSRGVELELAMVSSISLLVQTSDLSSRSGPGPEAVPWWLLGKTLCTVVEEWMPWIIDVPVDPRESPVLVKEASY